MTRGVWQSTTFDIIAIVTCRSGSVECLLLANPGILCSSPQSNPRLHATHNHHHWQETGFTYVHPTELGSIENMRHPWKEFSVIGPKVYLGLPCHHTHQFSLGIPFSSRWPRCPKQFQDTPHHSPLLKDTYFHKVFLSKAGWVFAKKIKTQSWFHEEASAYFPV